MSEYEPARTYEPQAMPTAPGQTHPTAAATITGPVKLRDGYFTLANYTRGLLVMAAIISLGVHLAAAVRWYDQPLGQVNPALLGQHRELLAVQRAPDMLFMDDLQSAGPAEQAPQRLDELSAALLQVDAPLPLGDPADASLNMRPVNDQHTPDLAAQLDEPAALPDATGDLLDVPLDLRLPLVDAAMPGDAESAGGAAGGSASAGGAAGGSGRIASDLLTQSRLLPAAAPQPMALDVPPVESAGLPLDQRLLETTAALPAIDFTELAWSDSTALEIPQNLDDDFDYTVATWTPPQRTGLFGRRASDPRGYFRVDITARRSLRKLPTMPKDMVFLLDVSENITPGWVAQMSRGVGEAIHNLNDGDRFNIVFFGSTIDFLSEDGLLDYTPANAQRAQRFLNSPHRGGTRHLEHAFSRLLVRDQAIERVYNILFISDGAPVRAVVLGEQFTRMMEGMSDRRPPVDTQDLINRITHDNHGLANIYSIGVGDRQNRELLDFLAYRNNGLSVAADRPADTAAVIRDLARRLRYPILRDLRFDMAGLGSIEDTVPHHLPNLHQGESFSIFGRFDQAKPFTMRLAGSNGQQTYDFTFTRDLRVADPGESDISDNWALWKLHHLYSEIIRQGENQALRDQIDQLRREYRLRTVY